MSPIAFAAIAFVLILASTVAGMTLRPKVPEHHLSGDSKEVIKLATALIATMAALVLALLFSSTRQSFEHTSAHVSRMTADIVELDQLLGDYGADAKPLHAVLRAEVGPLIDSIWREDAVARGVKPGRQAHDESVLYKLRQLAPQNAVQASIQARAVQVATDLAQTRLVLFAQPADSVSNAFMVVLIVWLMVIFAIFSMSSAPNPTLVAVLGVCILSASAAIYLILELGLPFGGLMQVSSDALRASLK